MGAKVTPLDSVGIYVPGGPCALPVLRAHERLACRRGRGGAHRVRHASHEGRHAGRGHSGGLPHRGRHGNLHGGRRAGHRPRWPTAPSPSAPVDKITGPGNAYVAAAKKIVSGDVGIDMIAGPSEVCVVADKTAEPALVAIDLMAQAEHDPLAACYLVTFDEAYADAVERDGRAAPGKRPRAPRSRPRPWPTRGSWSCATTSTQAIARGERHRARAPGAARATTPWSLLGLHPQRGRHLPGRVDARGRGRLRGRPQPHAAHGRHGALRQRRCRWTSS